MVFITGSSLYSLEINTHISMPVRSIKEGSKVSNLSVRISSITLALSFSGSTCALQARPDIKKTRKYLYIIILVNHCCGCAQYFPGESFHWGFPQTFG